MPAKEEIPFDRIIKDYSSLRQIDLWYLGFLIGIRLEESEDFSNHKKTTKAGENISVLLPTEKLHLIEATYFAKKGYEHKYDGSGLPAKVIRFAHDFAFAGLRKLAKQYNKDGDLGIAFANTIEEKPNTNSGLNL